MCQERSTNPECLEWVLITVNVCVRESFQSFEALKEFVKSLCADGQNCEGQRIDVGSSWVQKVIAVIFISLD